MNNYKFRGKECWIDDDGKKVLGKWVYGYLMDADKICPPNIDLTAPDFSDLIDFVAPETVGQFCGHDRYDNIDIFEKDIIQVWRHGSLMRTFLIEDIRTFMEEYSNDEHGAVWKIVGNIHDNPELLEDK